MVTRYLPTFKQLEPNLLYGLQMGHIVAQSPVAFSANTYGVTTVDKNGYKFIENGVICSLNLAGEVVNYSGSGKAFIHFTEELETFLAGHKYFAVEAEGAETYLRLVAVCIGDEFTTDNYVIGGATADYTVVDSTHAARYAVAINGVLNLYNDIPSSVELVYAVEPATLPNGTSAYSFKCVKCA